MSELFQKTMPQMIESRGRMAKPLGVGARLPFQILKISKWMLSIFSSETDAKNAISGRRLYFVGASGQGVSETFIQMGGFAAITRALGSAYAETCNTGSARK